MLFMHIFYSFVAEDLRAFNDPLMFLWDETTHGMEVKYISDINFVHISQIVGIALVTNVVHTA